MTGVLTDTLRFTAGQTSNQTSLRFLFRTAQDHTRLSEIIAANSIDSPQDHDLDIILEFLSEARVKGLRAKRFNSLLFFLSLTIFVCGSFWPAFDMMWLALQDDFASGLIQSALLFIGGVALTAYRHQKGFQTRIEDALRRTLFNSESVDEKITRLRELFATPGEREEVRRLANASVQHEWNLAKRDDLRARISTLASTPTQITEAQLASLAIQFKDAAIKAYSYRWISGVALVLATISIVLGLTLPVLVAQIDALANVTHVGLSQSLLVVGLGGLFLSVRAQYNAKLDGLLSARYTVLTRQEAYDTKVRRLPDAILDFDVGLAKK